MPRMETIDRIINLARSGFPAPGIAALLDLNPDDVQSVLHDPSYASSLPTGGDTGATGGTGATGEQGPQGDPGPAGDPGPPGPAALSVPVQRYDLDGAPMQKATDPTKPALITVGYDLAPAAGTTADIWITVAERNAGDTGWQGLANVQEATLHAPAGVDGLELKGRLALWVPPEAGFQVGYSGGANITAAWEQALG